MKHTLSVHAPTILAGMTTPALAGPRCLAPMTEWKPREIRVEKLRAEGWTIRRLTADDGCHELRATDAEGRRVKAKLDPETLKRVVRDGDDH